MLFQSPISTARVMANMPLKRQMVFETTLVAVLEAIVNSVSAKTAKTKKRHWEIWGSFCSDFNIDPFLQYEDLVPFGLWTALPRQYYFRQR